MRSPRLAAEVAAQKLQPIEFYIIISLLRFAISLALLVRICTRGYSSVMTWQGIITLEPGKRGGRPCVRQMRITVADVLGWLAAGMTHEDVLSDYPELTEEDIRACLSYAADRERGVLIAA
jgi:uncharacterized protein (DUF433 family)